MISFVKKHAGFSLIEIMISSAIGIALLGVVAAGMSEVLKNQVDVVGQSTISLDGDSLFYAIELDLYNVLRINPQEDLYTSGDSKYQGINALAGPIDGCQFSLTANGKTASAVRWTTVDRRTEPEKLLRPFDEGDTITTMNDGARISFSAEDMRIFFGSRQPKELTIFDADGWATRRFQVIETSSKSTNLSPYDDVTPLVNPVVYTQLRLGPGKTVRGVTGNRGDNKFITASSAYATSTKTLCISEKGHVVIKNESEDTILTLLNPAADNLLLTTFEIGYSKEYDGTLVSAETAEAFPSDPEEAKCINAVIVTIGLTPIADPNSVEQTISRSFLVPNFSSRKPAHCTQ